MEGLEKIGPFVSFCQLCGFFPYRMVVHPVTKRFKRFTFSICHPVTFWYFFVNLIQISYLLATWSKKETIKKFFRNAYHSENFGEMSPIQMLPVLTQKIDLVVVYILVHRLSLINEVVEFLDQVDEAFRAISNKSFNISPRIYIGLAYTFISVGIFISS